LHSLANLDLNLSAEQAKALDETSSIEPGFPYCLYEAQMTRALMYGGHARQHDRLMAGR